MVTEDALINFSRFSSWSRLLAVTECVLQVVDIFCKRKSSLLERKVKAEGIILKISQSVPLFLKYTHLQDQKPFQKIVRLLQLVLSSIMKVCYVPKADSVIFLRVVSHQIR